eukprot:m.185449 g.185449  ORF g.185449 m.185449 type:complete len:704 (-) comp24732_c0_seq1:5830-7941(-)
MSDPGHGDLPAASPKSPAPHLQKLLEKMKNRKRVVAEAAAEATLAAAAQHPPPSTERPQPQPEHVATAAAAAPAPTPAHGRATAHQGPSDLEFTTRLYREIAAQHEQQVLVQRNLHQQQLSSLQKELESHGFSAPPQHHHMATALGRLGLTAAWMETPQRRPNSNSPGTVVHRTAAARSPGESLPYHSPVHTPASQRGGGGTHPMPSPSQPPHTHLHAHGGNPASPATSAAGFAHRHPAESSAAVESRRDYQAELERQTLERKLHSALRRVEDAESKARNAETSRNSTQHTLDRMLEFQVSVQQVLQDLANKHRDLTTDYERVTAEHAECVDMTTEITKLRTENNELRDEISHRKDDGASAELKDTLQEERGRVNFLERKLGKAEDDAKGTAELLASANQRTVKAIERQNNLEEGGRVLEAKVADLQGEREQLRDKIKELEKALDRMRWPAGTTPHYDNHFSNNPFSHPAANKVYQPAESPAHSHLSMPAADTGISSYRSADGRAHPLSVQQPPTNVSASADFTSSGHGSGFMSGFPRQHRSPLRNGMVVSSSMDSTASGSMFSYPRARHANEETDFNIFTGAPKREHGETLPSDRTRQNRLLPETRMAWASDSVSPSRTSHRPPAASVPHAPISHPAAVAPPSDAVPNLLRVRLADITQERDVLRADLRSGYKDPDAQVRAEERVGLLDTQISSIEQALNGR